MLKALSGWLTGKGPDGKYGFLVTEKQNDDAWQKRIHVPVELARAIFPVRNVGSLSCEPT